MITVHPETGRKLTWATHYIWRDITFWKSEVYSIDIGEAEFQINQKIELLESNHLIVGGQLLNLAEYCDLLEFFAHFHQFAFSGNSNNRSKSDIEFSCQYYAAAHWYIAEWPVPFFALLEHFEKHPMSDRRLTGIRKCFRDLYDDIYSPQNSRSKAHKLLKSGFEEYLRESFSNGVLMRSLSLVEPKTKEHSMYISDTQVAEFLCCALNKVKIYIREKLLTPSHSLSNGTRLFLRADAIKLKARLENCCSIDKCAQLFGISVYHARQLLRVGIISPLIKPNTESRDWLIERFRVEELVNLLIACADPTVRKSSTAIRRYSFTKVDFVSLVESMLNGGKKYGYFPNKKQPFSLEQFIPYFDASDEPCGNYVSPTEATLELCVNINAIYDFIKLGYIECEKLAVKRTARPIKMIPKASIDKFKTSYLLTNNIRNMSKNGLRLLSGPKIDGCCVNLYSRDTTHNLD